MTCIFTAIIAALFLGPGRGERPDTIIQAFDSLTRERILRPFTLIFADGRTGASSDNEHRIKDTLPSDVQIKELEIHGFRKEGQDIQESTAGNDHLLKVYLDRSETFQDQIRPNPRNLKKPSDETLKSYVKGVSVAPEDVTLLVDNLTSQHIDVLMLWQPATDVREEFQKANPFMKLAGDWTPLAIPPGKRATFDRFNLKPGYFVFFGSVNGKEAVKLGEKSLYRAPYVHAQITELRYRGISFDELDTKPAERKPPNS